MSVSETTGQQRKRMRWMKMCTHAVQIVHPNLPFLPRSDRLPDALENGLRGVDGIMFAKRGVAALVDGDCIEQMPRKVLDGLLAAGQSKGRSASLLRCGWAHAAVVVEAGAVGLEPIVQRQVPNQSKQDPEAVDLWNGFQDQPLKLRP